MHRTPQGMTFIFCAYSARDPDIRQDDGAKRKRLVMLMTISISRHRESSGQLTSAVILSPLRAPEEQKQPQNVVFGRRAKST
jgi:hypothetical protein